MPQQTAPISSKSKRSQHFDWRKRRRQAIALLKKYWKTPIAFAVYAFTIIGVLTQVEGAIKLASTIYSNFWNGAVAAYANVSEKSLAEDLIQKNFIDACPIKSALLDLEHTGNPEYLFVSFTTSKMLGFDEKGQCTSWGHSGRTHAAIFKRGNASFFGEPTGLRPNEQPKGIRNTGLSSPFTLVQTIRSEQADISYFDIRGNWVLLISAAPDVGTKMKILGWQDGRIDFIPTLTAPLTISWRSQVHAPVRIFGNNLRVRDGSKYYEIFFDKFTRSSHFRPISEESIAPRSGLTRRLETKVDGDIIRTWVDGIQIHQCAKIDTWDLEKTCELQIHLQENEKILLQDDCRQGDGLVLVPETVAEYRLSKNRNGSYINCWPRGPGSGETDVVQIQVTPAN